MQRIRTFAHYWHFFKDTAQAFSNYTYPLSTSSKIEPSKRRNSYFLQTGFQWRHYQGEGKVESKASLSVVRLEPRAL